MASKIIITIGNPNGIGPEICFKALKKLNADQLKDIIIIGDRSSIKRYFSKNIQNSCELIYPDIKNKFSYELQPGKPTLSSGALSFLFLEKAMEIAKKINARALVTSPISKELIVNAGIAGLLDNNKVKNFKGHTDYLGKSFSTNKYNMMFYSDDLIVVLTTIHVSIKDVIKNITKEKLESAIDNSIAFCKHYYPNNKYTIGVCGLNPHAGEKGLMGDEEINIIAPVIDKYKRKGYSIEGPMPADSLFYYARKGKYSLVIAMYHDQGLTPFKLLHFMDGVNVTLGLPLIRTSPDHGTAFNIAGKNIADETSMFNALKFSMGWRENNELK